MPLRETEAFVLRARPLGESDRIVTFLTRGSGKLRGVAKGARRSRRRFGTNLELLSRVRLAYFEKERADLVRVESAELLESFFALQQDPERGAALACLAEVTEAFAREEQEDEAFFRLLHAVLGAVRDGLDLDRALRYFEIWTLRLHGVMPDLTRCGSCGADTAAAGAVYDRRDGAVLCGGCGGAPRPGRVALPKAAVVAVMEILRRPPAAFVGVPAGRALAPLASLTAALLADVIERPLKSYAVLRSLRGATIEPEG